MKILYIVTQADSGGAQKYVLAMAKAFKGAIAAGTESGELFAAAQKDGLTTFPLSHLKRNISPWHDFLAVFELYRLIRSHRPDIVHLNSSKAGFLGTFAAAAAKFASNVCRLFNGREKTDTLKIIFTAHGFRFNEPLPPVEKQIYKDLERLASMLRDHVITISDKEKELAMRFHIVDPNKISTIYNGIAPINFLRKDEARQNLNLPPDKFIFGTIANFYRTKGIDMLIDAVKQLPGDIQTKCKFVIIGDGPENENLKFKIKNLKLENTILMPGKLMQASGYLKAFDTFVLPSRKEGLPYTLLEAIQAGLPIIATDVGGNREAIQDAGLIIEPENPAALCQAMLSMFNNPAARQTFSQKSLARSSLFTENLMLEKTQELYTQILGVKDSP